jgi:hypothetical protein
VVLGRWKTQFVMNAYLVFESGRGDESKDQRIAELERLLGKQALELEIARVAARQLWRTPLRPKKALLLADFQRQKGGS